jgi:glucose-1-phosphatase
MEAVLFDLGGVLIKLDWTRTIRCLCEAFPGLGETETIQCLFKSELSQQFETGAISSQDFVEGVGRQLGIPLDHDFFLGCWNGIFSPIPPMIDFLSELRGKVRLGAVSNTNPLHMSHLAGIFEFLEWFDFHVYSYEVGCTKPDKGIFETALKQAKVRPDRCFFLDDRLENVQAARALGMVSHLFIEPAEAIRIFNQAVKSLF